MQMSVNTVCFFGYGVKISLTDEQIRENPELDDFNAWLEEHYPLLDTACSGNAFDVSKPMTRWVFIKSSLQQMWGYEEAIHESVHEPFDDEHQELLRFIVKEGLAHGRVGTVMIRQVG